MRLGTMSGPARDVDDLFQRFFGTDSPTNASTSRFEVPTDVFHIEDALKIRLDLPGVDPGDVEVTVQENNLLVNGKRRFPYEASDVRFAYRGTFYGDFTQRVALGKGLRVEDITARYDNGVLELTIPYAEQVTPRKIDIEVGHKALTS